MAEDDDNVAYSVFHQPSPKLSAWQTVRIFAWNSETKTVFGRTGLNWAKLTAFYIMFYAILAVFCAIFFSLFFLTISYRSPKWQLDRSLIGTSPGLGFRPMLTDTSNSDSTLIWFNKSNKKNNQFWVDNLLEFLNGYYAPRKFAKGNGKIVSCSQTKYPSIDEVCEVDVGDWGPCSREIGFNFNRSTPCIFLKLNKIYGWAPDYYLKDDELPDEMPQQLKNYIRSIKNPVHRKNVWLSCDGESILDKQHVGPMTYYPKDIQGFPGYFFPYLNQENYLGPLVAVMFEKPTPGILINIECRAWAKNIEYNRADRSGSVHFELLVDN